MTTEGGFSHLLSSSTPAQARTPSPSDPASPVHGGGHSYAQQVGYFLQQQVPLPTVQSGGPRTTPSGYPGGPVVPPGQVSPKVARRGWVAQQEQVPSDNVIRQGAGGPLTFTRALEMSDSLASERARANGSVRL